MNLDIILGDLEDIKRSAVACRDYIQRRELKEAEWGTCFIAEYVGHTLMDYYQREKQRRRSIVLSWLRWLEHCLDFYIEFKHGEEFKKKLSLWADDVMKRCVDSLGILSENEREEFIGLLKDTFEMGVNPESVIAGTIQEKAKRLLDDLEKKWEKTIKEDSTDTG